MKVSVTFPFPGGYKFKRYFKAYVLLCLGGLNWTLIQLGRLDVFFWKRSFGKDESFDTSGKGIWSFVKMVGAD